MSIRIATLTIDELQVGKEEAFEQAIVEADIDDFAKVSGDISPVHMDAAFARTCGFKGRVVHGGLLTALVSRLIGVYLPGRNCLWQSCQIGFVAPAYAGMTVRVAGVVNQVSVAVQSAEIKVNILDTATSRQLARGKVTVGFLKEAENG